MTGRLRRTRLTLITVLVDLEPPDADDPNPWASLVHQGLQDEIRTVAGRYDVVYDLGVHAAHWPGRDR